MPRRHSSIAVVAAALAVPATTVGAAGASEDELREAVVTARSLEVTTPLELSRYGYDVEFVTSKQVRDQGFVDLTQALEMLVPGAHVSTQAGAFSYVNLSLQGSRTGDVLWTVDGVRINNRLYNGTSPADTLPASMIERVEVLKGGHGLLYGTQAAAGVINVVTRSFPKEAGGAVSVGGDSRNGLHVDGHAGATLAGHRLIAWASKDRSDGYDLYDAYQPGAAVRDRGYDVESYGLKYGYEFSDALRLTLQGVHTQAALDYPTVGGGDVNDRNEETWSSRLDYSPSERTDLFLKAYLHDWDTDYFPFIDPDEVAYWGYRDFGFSAASRFDLGRGLEYHLGYDFQNYRGRDESLLIEGLAEKAHAVYGQVRTTNGFSTRTRLTAGLRHNDAGGSRATVWSASGVHDITDALYVEGSLGTSFLLPDAYQLYAIDPFDTHGNPNLKPEESFNINLAIGGRLMAGGRPLAWQVTGWQRRVKNLIVSDDSNPPPGFDGMFVNSDGKSKASGAELLLRGALTNVLSFDASYLYSRERNATGVRLPDRPRHSAKLGLDLEPPGGSWGVNLALKYAGHMYTNVTGFGRQDYGDFVVANLGAHWHPDAAKHHRLGIRVENLFDTYYETRIRSAVLADSDPPERFMYRNQGAPRTGYVNYSYTF